MTEMDLLSDAPRSKEEDDSKNACPSSEELASASKKRTLDVYETLTISSSTFRVLAHDHITAFYVQVSLVKPGTPDLTLFTEQEGVKGRVLGVANFVTLTSQTKLGLGDPSVPGEMVWEDLTKEHINYSQYRWEMTINGERRAFLWKRTRTVGTEEIKPFKLSSMCFKLVPEQSEELLAVFANREWKTSDKTGQLEIRKSYGNNFDIMVLLSGLSLLEKARRRERRDIWLLSLSAGKRVVGSLR